MNIINRELLGFQEAVKKHFTFLEDQYGFSIDSSDLYCVKYSSDKVYLNVYHEKLSYEIYFEIGLLPENYHSQLKVSSREIFQMSGLKENVFYQASNIYDINKIVEKLSNLIKTHAIDALNGTIDYFEVIANERTQRQKDALLLQELKIVDEKAKTAWNNGDFKTVVELYQKFRKYLNPIQVKKLDYAKKTISDNVT